MPRIVALLGGGGGEPPVRPTAAQNAEERKKTEEILQRMRETMKQTPQEIPVPPQEEKDPGGIYVHTKAIIINNIFAMLGSANHNERSMWHDMEDMLAVRGDTKEHFPGQLQKELLETVLSGDLPKSMDGKKIFDRVTRHLKDNVAEYSQGNTQRSLIFPFIPEAAFGSAFFT